MMPVVLLGSPGSGKGTQGKLLSAYFGIPHISTGEILRDNVQRRTVIGDSLKEIIGTGRLVPDDVMQDLLFERLKWTDCEDGYILDGFPRTIQQAQWFYAHFGQPLVVWLDVPEQEVLRRIAARNEGRADDTSSTVAGRMEEYHKLTMPVIDYYIREASLYRVDGTIGAQNVFEWIKNLMESKEQIAYG
jgi:adenylate kinase